MKLEDLPEFSAASQEHLKNLAVRNLLRGKQMQLPSGQQVASYIQGETGREVRVLSEDQIPFENEYIKSNTPLWYYILCESVAHGNGDRLGDVGSWIVADTFRCLT
eukprot:UN21977